MKDTLYQNVVNTKRNEKGITLINLVVTIILLIILAGVSLSMVLGDNGIIEMAKKRQDDIAQEVLEDQQRLNELYEQSASGSGWKDTDPTTPGGSGGTGGSGNSGSTGGNTEAGGSTLTGGDIKRENYGEYVDYGLDINKNGDTTDDWRIFYTNDEGRIFLISADYVPNTSPALQTALDSNHTNMNENGNYACYWAKISTSTGIDCKAIYSCNDGHNTTLNSGKTQCSFPNLFMPSGNFCSSTNHYYCSDHVGTGKGGNRNSRCASALQCTDNWKSFVENSKQKEYADYAIGGPTLEMWVASWNKVHGASTETDVEGGITLYANGNSNSNSKYGYYVGTVETCSTTAYGLGNTAGYNDTLYFLDSSSCESYWIASPSVIYDDELVVVTSYGSITGKGIDEKDTGVRPVVCLKSGVKLTKNESKSTEDKVVYDLSIANS